MKEGKNFNSNDVMAYILGVAEKNGFFWNVTKAQKLMYCCYGTVLAAFGERLTEEAPQAWKYGPVFTRTIHGLRKNRIKPGDDHGFSTSCNPAWLPLIEQTVKAFGKFSASQLSTWSHAPGSPWARATNDGTELWVQIPDAHIEPLFASFITLNHKLNKDAPGDGG